MLLKDINKKLFPYKLNFICDLINVNTCIFTAYFCRLLAFQSIETKLKQIRWCVIFVAVYATSFCIYLTAYNFLKCFEEVCTDLIINISNISLVEYFVFDTRN